MFTALRDFAPATRAAGLMATRMRSALVVGQTALAFILVAATVLLAVSLRRVLALPLGFDAGIATMRVAVPAARYRDKDSAVRFFSELADEIAQRPGVQNAGFVSALPLSGGAGSALTIQGREDIPVAARPGVGWQWANPTYFVRDGNADRTGAWASPLPIFAIPRTSRSSTKRSREFTSPARIRSATACTSARSRPRACRSGIRSSAWSGMSVTAGWRANPTRAPTICSGSIGAAPFRWRSVLGNPTPQAAAMVRSALAARDPRLAVFAVRTHGRSRCQTR